MNNTNVKDQLSRRARRFKERIEAEARETHDRLANKFLIYFTNCDNPEGSEVQEKMKQIDAQWRIYCTQRQLNPAALPVVNNYMLNIIDHYRKSKGTVDGQ